MSLKRFVTVEGLVSLPLAGDDHLEWRGVCAVFRVSRFTYPKLLR